MQWILKSSGEIADRMLRRDSAKTDEFVVDNFLFFVFMFNILIKIK